MEYGRIFRGWRRILDTHRGYDPGALAMARQLSGALDAPLVASTVSRLLIDLNRSAGHPALFSEASRQAPRAIRERIVQQHYRPYRRRVESWVEASIARGRPVIHISSHSFTPCLNGDKRNADVGVLYDPARPGEQALAKRWQSALQSLAPSLVVRRNYPYLGQGDGLTTHLRRRHNDLQYIGIELEVNQKHVNADRPAWQALRKVIAEALAKSLR